jgi:SAM-dependent methyltransferase
MDIDPAAIRWCSAHITSRHPNFTFFCADLQNDHYNPSGRLSAAEYSFPLPDASFDMIHLRSVFTHMAPAGTSNYLREIARLLAPHGRCLATFFLFDKVHLALANRGLGIAAMFPFGEAEFRHTNAQVPEEVCAYRTDYVEELVTVSGLRLLQPPIYGRWAGRPEGLSGQDILLLAIA